MGDQAVIDLIVEMGERRPCVRCAVTYRELDNLGTHRCAYHPGAICQYDDVGVRRGNYECCNLSPKPGNRDYAAWRSRRGCTPTDHIEYGDQYLAEDMTIDLAVGQQLMSPANLCAPGVYVDTERCQLRIRRVGAVN